jgi:predicted TIM-barrel fold metal-dependent hydrolase
LPRHLATHELVQAAWEGLDPAQVWDAHAHLLGVGDSSSGIAINPGMQSLSSPSLYLRRVFFLNGACAYSVDGSVDQAYVRRLVALCDGMKRGSKLLLFAFDRAHTDEGRRDDRHTGFFVPNGYALQIAREYPRLFEWVASIHPYRADALDALEQAARDGARAVKWIPASMNIDPASPRCDRFYEALVRLKIPLVSHAGLERAVLGGNQAFGNPLRLRRPLDAGVRVVVAHCASMGEDRDTDKGENGPVLASSELFFRLMEERKFEKNLFGDLSAMTQVNRAGPALVRVLERSDWHARLLNGSDYPLPGVMPLFSLNYLVSLGLLGESMVDVLSEIRTYNALLFDFVLKRHLRSNGKAFSKSVFETRAFFAAKA